MSEWSHFLENDWQSCVSNFERSIKAYKSYITINTLCRRQCQNVPKQDLILAENASEELLFYEKKVLSTLCLLKCKFSQPDFVSADEFVHREQLFLHETFEAYNYLQLCYYQVRHFLTIQSLCAVHVIFENHIFHSSTAQSCMTLFSFKYCTSDNMYYPVLVQVLLI